MSRSFRALATLAALLAAGTGGYLAARPDLWPQRMKSMAATTPVVAQATKSEDAAYYQHPDGKPAYSLTSKQTEDGRDFRPVPASADLSFEVTGPAAAVETQRKIKFYRNPMGLPDTSPVPKKDSMGMAYIAVYDGEDSGDGSVKLSPGKIQRTGVKSELAAPRVIRTMIRAPGTIQLDERRVTVISMRTDGWIQKVEDVTTGTKVAKGQPLLSLYSPVIAAAAAEHVSVMGSPNAASAANNLGRGSRQRLMNLDVPEAVIVAMEKTRTVPLSIPWTAPRDGIVLERNAVEGMRAQAGDVLFRLGDASVVWALVDVAERDLAAISVGQPVIVRARAFIGRQFAGKVSVIYPQINRETRTARVRIELPNPDIALLPDMYVDAEIDSGSPSPVLAVPESAVLDTGTRQALFVDKGEGRLEPRDVKLGARGGGYVEIREGVAAGESVVVSANFLIDAESNLKAALKGFGEAEAPK